MPDPTERRCVQYLFLWTKPGTGEIEGKELSHSLWPKRPACVAAEYEPRLFGRHAVDPKPLAELQDELEASWRNTPGLSWLERVPWVDSLTKHALAASPA